MGRAVLRLLALAGIVAASGGIAPAARAGEAADGGRWETAARAALEQVARQGFSFRTGQAYVAAMDHLGRQEEALAWARRCAIPAAAVDGQAVLADALINAGCYNEARQVLRGLAGFTPVPADGRQYLDRLRERAASRTYRLTWQIKQEEAAQMKPEWFAPPQDTANQKLVKLDIQGAAQAEEKHDAWGNRLIRLAPTGDGPLVVIADVKLTPLSARELLPRLKGDVTDEVRQYLGKSPGIDPEAEEIRAIGGPLAEKPWAERVQGVMSAANARLTYCPPGSPPGLDSAVDALRRGGGHCEAISMVEAACLRAAGVPARLIRGQSAINGEAGTMCQHTIVEYWLPGIGWVDWDHKMRLFEMRANFVRLGSYPGQPADGVAPLFFFHGREFKAAGVYRNGPYRYRLLGTSLDP